MKLTIQLHPSDDLQLLATLLQVLRQHEVEVTITQHSSTSRRVTAPRTVAAPGIASRLYGSVTLPEGFDYKASVAEELMGKYGTEK